MMVIIVHGWEGNSSGNWFPWLKSELETTGIPCVCPNLPNASFPEKEKWTEAIERLISSQLNEFVLVGHSLGVAAILRVLERTKEKALAVILVAGFANEIGIAEISNFTQDGFDFAKIRKSAKKLGKTVLRR